MGLLYATNTAGAIVGCLLSGFVLIGRLGLAETIFAAAPANALAGGARCSSRPVCRTQPSLSTRTSAREPRTMAGEAVSRSA